MCGQWSNWKRAVVTALMAAGLAAAPAAANPTPWLGVAMQDLTEDLREGLGYRDDGVLVSQVFPGSPAERAGVRKGDVITSVNSRTVRTPGDVIDIVRDARLGQTVAVAVWRGGARQTLSARLGQRPADVEMLRAERPDGPERDRRIEIVVPEGRDRRVIRLRDGDRREFDTHDLGLPGVRRHLMMLGGSRGRLGVRVHGLGPGLAEYFRAPGDQGALVLEVLKDTPAERAGVKAGDVIQRVGDQPVADADDLVRALRDREGAVTLAVVRKGAERNLTAELEPRPSPRPLRLRGSTPQRGEIRRWVDDALGDMRVRRGMPRSRGGLERDGDLRHELRDELRELRRELRDLRRRLEEIERD